MKKMKHSIFDNIVEKCREIDSPIVSIGVLVYNQKEYISLAIESILNQEVNFDYEIVIADDCSNDGTRDILINYQQKYPKIIKLILQEKNIGLAENSKILKRACKGRYRATLEGDDYWINNQRLQQQVDFLENNRDFSAVCGGLISIDESGGRCVFPWGGVEKSYRTHGVYTKEDFNNWKLPCHVSAWLAYNWYYILDNKNFNIYESYPFPGDRKTPLFTMGLGKIFVNESPFMVRRLLYRSKSSHISTLKEVDMSAFKVFNWCIQAELMDREFCHVGISMIPTLNRMIVAICKQCIKKKSIYSIKLLLKALYISRYKKNHLKVIIKKSLKLRIKDLK